MQNVTGEFLGVTNCNVSLKTEAEVDQYDADGALKFTVAVVMVYGIAVIGVFTVSYVSRRKLQNYDVDKQARSYVKSMDDVNHKLERKNRLNSINYLLKNIHGDSYKTACNDKSIQEGLLSYVGFPVMVVSGVGNLENTDVIEHSNASLNTKPQSSTQLNSPKTETLPVLKEETEDKANAMLEYTK